MTFPCCLFFFLHFIQFVLWHTQKEMEVVGIKQFLFQYTLKSTQIGLRHFSFGTQFIRDFYSEKRGKFTREPTVITPLIMELMKTVSYLYDVIGTRCDPHTYKALTDKIKAVALLLSISDVLKKVT